MQATWYLHPWFWLPSLIDGPSNGTLKTWCLIHSQPVMSPCPCSVTASIHLPPPHCPTQLTQSQRWSSLAQLLFLRLHGLPWSSTELQHSGCPHFNHCSGFSETSSYCPALSWIFSLPIPSSSKHCVPKTAVTPQPRQRQPAAGLGVLTPFRTLAVPEGTALLVAVPQVCSLARTHVAPREDKTLCSAS